MSFGRSSNLHHLILRLSQDLTLVIEIVDSEKAIYRLIDEIGGMMGSASGDYQEGQGNPVRHQAG